MTPAKDLQEYVDSFFIFLCCDLSDSLAYNDGTPMLAFLSEVEDEVELEYNGAIYRFKLYRTNSHAVFAYMQYEILPHRIAKQDFLSFISQETRNARPAFL